MEPRAPHSNKKTLETSWPQVRQRLRRAAGKATCQQNLRAFGMIL